MFKVIKKSKISKARLGLIKTSRGVINTPFFMPDATRGQVKNLSYPDLIDLGLEGFVANTLHLFLRPGVKLVKQAGGLHKFIGWARPILTDSGGYQIFSLIHKNKSGADGRITDTGATFRSPLDGSKLKLTPELSIKIQFDLGADMIVCLDDCPPNDYNNAKLETAVQRTIKWAKRCSHEYKKIVKSHLSSAALAKGEKSKVKNYKRPLLFAVIQGGNNLALREHCAKELVKIGFDGFGFGARHIDTEGNFLADSLKHTADQIPENKLRFGLGIGLPEDIVRSVKMGYDMFDCVIPTREGRHGRLFMPSPLTPLPPRSSRERGIGFPPTRREWEGSREGKFYETVNITNAKFAKDFSPINARSGLSELRKLSKAYLHYLFKINEPSASRLASLNNLEFYLNILSEIKRQIKNNAF